MADWPPKKNSAFTATYPIYDNDGDLVTGAAALDSEVSKDGGTFTDATNEAGEIATSSGIYTLALTATEMNADIVATITKTTTTDAKTAVNVMYTATRQLLDLAYPTVSGRSMDVDASGGVEVGSHQAGAITSAAFAAGAIDAAAIATGAIDADALAADALTEIRSLVSGTADSGSTTTMVDAARTEADTDYWKGKWVLFTSGSIANQVRLITAFDPATDTSTFAPATTQAVSTNTYEILPAAAMDLRLWLGSAPNALQSGRVDSYLGATAAAVIAAASFAAGAIDANAIGTGAIDADAIAAAAITAAKFAAGAIDASAIATGAIDADAIAANAIGASELAADAALEIADAILQRDMDQVEAAAPVHSLVVAILKAVSRIRDNAGTLEVYQTNGTTLKMSQTVTTDAALNPVDELSAGS
jgi:hypothetical protein